jgi:hypothetical protein
VRSNGIVVPAVDLSDPVLVLGMSYSQDIALGSLANFGVVRLCWPGALGELQ